MAFTQLNIDNSGLWWKETINCSVGVCAKFPGLATETFVRSRKEKTAEEKAPRTHS